MTKTINEINRMVVEFGSILDADTYYPISRDTQAWLVLETCGLEAEPIWKSAGDLSWEYSHFGNICREQVLQAEFKERLINGKAMKAETYLGLWRQACTKPLSLDELQKQGITIVANISHPTLGLIEESKRLPTSFAREAMESRFVIRTSDTETFWSIPLIDLPNLAHYSKICGLYFSTSDYPYEGRTPRSLSLLQQQAKAPLAAHAVSETFDLFAFEGVSA